jgi:hypothetical protein
MALIPEGTYVGRVESAEFKTSSKNGTDYFGCVCVVTESSEFTGKDGKTHNTKGTRLQWNGWLNSEDNIQKNLQTMRGAGCTFLNDDYTDVAGVGTKDVLLVVQTERGEGQDANGNPYPDKSRVAFINEIARDTVGVAMSADKKKVLAEKMKRVMSAAKNAKNADGSRVDDKGVLRNAKDDEVF